MEEWLGALKNVSTTMPAIETGTAELLGGHHQWYATIHARPTYCNVCRDALYGVTSHGLSCEVCKYKVHKRCSAKAINNCKWTTLASIGKDIIEDQDGTITMPHQWMEGNLPVASKCAICEKICGSVLRLQDWRCLWCKVTVHTACRPFINIKCRLGPANLSVVSPTALNSIGSDEAWEAVRLVGSSPLLVFVNSKSGDNQGIKFLRRFKQLLNPAQVFDLNEDGAGPGPGLRLFRHFDPFRILVCSGDGSVGWVLSEIDRLGMHKQCRVGILPLGTGNDLARVLGWGASCDDDTHFPQLLEKYEKAGTTMLDRWSIMIFERNSSLLYHKILNQPDQIFNRTVVHEYEDSIISHITKILNFNEEAVAVSSVRDLCETVKDLAMQMSETSLRTGDQQLHDKCQVLQQKLDLLLRTLNEEEIFLAEFEENNTDTLKSEYLVQLNEQEKGLLEKPEKDVTKSKNLHKRKSIKESEAVLSRANSLKRAICKLVEYTDQIVSQQMKTMEFPNITITGDSSSQTAGNKRHPCIPEVRMENMDSSRITPAISSGHISPCFSPTPNIASLSPMPDIRRDSHPYEILTLPAPDDFADIRRNSSTVPQGAFNFDAEAVVSTVDKLSELQHSLSSQMGKASQPEKKETHSSRIEVNTTPTALSTSSPSDDTTIQDAIISPDTDSMASGDIFSEFLEIVSAYARKIETPRGSSTNSIVSSDSMILNAFDSKNIIVKNNESEIGYIDSEILDSTKRSESFEMCHIDSTENSELFSSDILNSESIIDDLSSLGQDVISSILGEKYDSVRECLESEQLEQSHFCHFAKFDGNDITGTSVKMKNSSNNKEGIIKGKSPKAFTNMVEIISGMQSKDENLNNEVDNTPIDLPNTSVRCFAVNSNLNPINDELSRFPPKISVYVDPPSPSISVESKHDKNDGFCNLDSHFGIFGMGSMEKLNVEYPDGVWCSPQATRRISSGSLLKASDVVSLAATTARFGGSNMSLKHEYSKSIDKTNDAKKLPIINPLVRLPMWPNVSGGLISQALLANADALCAAVSPLMDPHETLMEGFFERSVMNNYFGIGIDAKISLDFHHKREEHPEKCRSRAKNYMWYGVLGSKQLLQKTYRNLDQRVQLECDGQRIPLPSLQGIVVLNIPSFMGGTNFWGGTKEDDIFLAPSFDDRILEVVAVFGSVQMAASRLINLQHHRIAQCQTVQINIFGDEGVPIQVDGEAWVQPPGIIRIIHKNRMQMLYRNRALETSLRTWEEKQRNTGAVVNQSCSTHSSSSRLYQSQFSGKQTALTDDEMAILLSFIEIVTTFVKWVKLLIISHPNLEPNLYQIAARTDISLEKVHPNGKILQGPNLRQVITELVSCARQLYEESCELLRDKAHKLRLRKDLEDKLSTSLGSMEQELRKCIFDERESGLVYLQNIAIDEQVNKKNRHRGLFWLKFRRSGGNSTAGSLFIPRDFSHDQINLWGVQEVCSWLEYLQLSDYTENFISHDIRGKELLTLARRDLKELGITKVGHVKRILQAINDLNS